MTKYIFTVCQTQPDAEIDGLPIAAYEDENRARKLARRLNKQYGAACLFTDAGDFCGVNGAFDLCHYYTVERVPLNPDEKNYL